MSTSKSGAKTAAAAAGAADDVDGDATMSAKTPNIEQLVEAELERLGQGGRWVWYELLLEDYLIHAVC